MQNSVALHYFKMRLSGAICLLTSGGRGGGGGGLVTWVFFGWVCAAWNSKLAPRFKKISPKTDTPF